MFTGLSGGFEAKRRFPWLRPVPDYDSSSLPEVYRDLPALQKPFPD